MTSAPRETSPERCPRPTYRCRRGAGRLPPATSCSPRNEPPAAREMRATIAAGFGNRGGEGRRDHHQETGPMTPARIKATAPARARERNGHCDRIRQDAEDGPCPLDFLGSGAWQESVEIEPSGTPVGTPITK